MLGEPVICPVPLMLTPGGRPAAPYERVCPVTGSAAASWRFTGSPVTSSWEPGSRSGISAGLSWSRSVFPGALIPLTVPVLEYCQKPHVLQPTGRDGLVLEV